MLKQITKERIERFKQVISKRQKNLTIILENVHDPHNIGAVMRSCDAVGITEIYLVYTEEGNNNVRQYIGSNSASGAKKWVKALFFQDLESCFEAVRNKYSKIFGTHLSVESSSLYDLDLTESVALVFGNEQKGISEEAKTFLDGNFIIPQYGMVQSLNISVACAVSLFEASRQRKAKKMYEADFNDANDEHVSMFNEFVQSHYAESIEKAGRNK
ncbi:MAG: RNA methyltransferase [Saprospiraceae bacterium]|nr:RNA methyltransferase [Saprospiraceae bacterium]